MQLWLPRAAHGLIRLLMQSVCGHAQGTNIPHVSFAICMAFARSFKINMLNSALRLLSSATAVGRQALICTEASASSRHELFKWKYLQTKKERSAFMLLCNLGFIPQRHLHTGKNKTLNANVYFCPHPWRWLPLSSPGPGAMAVGESPHRQHQNISDPVTWLEEHVGEESVQKRCFERNFFLLGYSSV